MLLVVWVVESKFKSLVMILVSIENKVRIPITATI